MKTYEYSRTGEKLYTDKLENGFQTFVIPSTKKNTFYAALGVKYGSSDIGFIPLNRDDYIETNYGIAHFLEHLAFAMKDGEDPFVFFNKSGVNSNASTSFYATKYYIWGTKEFNKNLNYLLTFVLSPYFTDENVNNERGIINEEIKMYEDDPSWCIDDIARKMIFKELPIKEKISGTINDVKKITKEELYDCYNTFYVPNNMFLVVGGCVSVDEVFEIVRNHKILKDLKPNYNIKRKQYHEMPLVVNEYQQLKMNVFIPKMKYAFKFSRNKFSIKDKLKLNMYLNMIITIIFGSTSEFNEIVRDENYATGFYVECNSYNDYYCLEFVAETERADIFKDLVDKYLINLKICKEDFQRIKRVWIASEIKITDNEDFLADSVLDDLITYDEFYTNRIDVIEKLNMKELNKVIKELDLENSCFVLVNPKES